MQLAKLEAARELLSDPARWTKGAGARAKTGNIVDPREVGACKWCATGALERAGASYFNECSIYFALNDVALELFPARMLYQAGDPHIVSFNDHPDTTHAELLHVFDTAISRCRPQADRES